jgi:hypothetical protein
MYALKQFNCPMFGSPREWQATNVCLCADNTGFLMHVVEIETDNSLCDPLGDAKIRVVKDSGRCLRGTGRQSVVLVG